MYIIVVLVEFGSTTLLLVFSFPYFSFLSSSFPAFFFFLDCFYYVGDYRKVVTNKKMWLTAVDVAGKTFPDGSMLEVGYHYFDETGKLVY